MFVLVVVVPDDDHEVFRGLHQVQNHFLSAATDGILSGDRLVERGHTRRQSVAEWHVGSGPSLQNIHSHPEGSLTRWEPACLLTQTPGLGAETWNSYMHKSHRSRVYNKAAKLRRAS